jgi:CO dehydrogenase nickel-insertion accessory protein CooC1
MILGELGELRQLVIGSIHFDQHLISWGLTGASLESYPSVEGFKHIAEQL